MVEIIIIAMLIGLIPAFIAKSKGRSFFLWYIYGASLFIIAIIHSIIISPHKNTHDVIASDAISPDTHMICPDCKEYVRIGAVVCKHCSCRFSEEKKLIGNNAGGDSGMKCSMCGNFGVYYDVYSKPFCPTCGMNVVDVANQ